MSRYKIVKMEKELSAKEVESYKDFKVLLHTYNKKQQNKKVIKILALIGLVGSIGLLLVFYPYSSNQLNSESMSEGEDPAKEVISRDSINEVTIPSKQTIKTPEVSSKKEDSVHLESKKPVKKKKTEANTEPEYVFLKAYPEYGMDSLISYIQNSLKPDQIHEVKGEVVVAFTISALGEPGSVKLMKGLSQEVDAQVLELIKNMPNWKPAMLNGKPVSSTHTLPLEINTYSK